MPRGLPALQPNEAVLWNGKPAYHPKRITAIIILATILLAASRLPSFPTSEALALAVFAVVAILLSLPDIYKYGGVRYYITERRIIRQQSLFALNRSEEFPVEALVDIRAKRLRGQGFVGFVSTVFYTIVFGRFEEDPERIKQIAIDARSQFDAASRRRSR